MLYLKAKVVQIAQNTKKKTKKKTTATSSCHSRPTNLREFFINESLFSLIMNRLKYDVRCPFARGLHRLFPILIK